MFKLRPCGVAILVFTVLSDPIGISAAETYSVEYRTASWKTIHCSDPRIADVCQADMISLGCETKRVSHANHHDVSFQCSQWRRKVVPSHSEAHEWEQWLKANGFETRHSH